MIEKESSKSEEIEINSIKTADDDVFSKPELPPPPPSFFQVPKPAPPQQQQQVQKCDYIEPDWSSIPSKNDDYFFECIKNGTQLENFYLNQKSHYTIGRYYTCDLMLEHPSLSRFHAIIQYSNGEIDVNYPKGFYLFDNSSTHGTVLNKQKIEAKKHVYIKIGSCIKFGGSTRLFILHGPELPNADDLNINLTHEQMKKLREKQNKLALKLRIQKEIAEEQQASTIDSGEEEEEGIDWGINGNDVNEANKSGDAAVLKNVTFNADQSNEDNFYASDPRKALKIFFEREGENLNYECEELGYSRFKCRIRLPIDNDLGESVYAEVTSGEGKKKDCMAQCALEACRILDSVGVLRQSNSEYRKRKKEKDWESNDYYDSDEDTFLDRTGDIEKKRLKRIDKFGIGNSDNESKKKVLTFDSLKQDFRSLNEELLDINMKLEKCKNITNAVQNDDIDAYIYHLKQRDNNKLDTLTRMKLKRRTIDINQELIKLDKLLNLAKPAGFDLIKWKTDSIEEIKNSKLNTEVKVAEIKEEILPPVKAPVQIPEVLEVKRLKIEKEKRNEEKLLENVEHKVQREKRADVRKNEEDEVLKMDYNSEFKCDKDYSLWLPPVDQSGDGKTKLNAKFGY